MPFPFELAQRAWASSIASMSTSTLAVVGSLIYPLSDIWREFRHSGRSGVRKHWKETLRYSLVIGFCWWSVLFSYHLFYKVPHEINMEAQSIGIPRHSDSEPA